MCIDSESISKRFHAFNRVVPQMEFFVSSFYWSMLVISILYELIFLNTSDIFLENKIKKIFFVWNNVKKNVLLIGEAHI